MNPLERKQKLIEKFKARKKTNEFVGFKDLKISISKETIEWYRNNN